MSFIKSLVKEIGVAKSMLDIPGLKQNKETLQLKIQVCNTAIDKLKQALENETNILITAKSIQKYKLCLSDNVMQEKAEEVAAAMQQSVTANKELLEEETKKLDVLLQEMDNVNDLLKKARANVKGK